VARHVDSGGAQAGRVDLRRRPRRCGAGVSKYPIDVTAAMLAAYRAGKSTISAFAAIAGATVAAIDVGVGRPTGDIRVESALSPTDSMSRAPQGAQPLRRSMPICWCSARWASATHCGRRGGRRAQRWRRRAVVGRGTGVDDDGLARKRDAVRTAVERIAV